MRHLTKRPHRWARAAIVIAYPLTLAACGSADPAPDTPLANADRSRPDNDATPAGEESPACETLNILTAPGSPLPAIEMHDCDGNLYRLDELASHQVSWLYIHGST